MSRLSVSWRGPLKSADDLRWPMDHLNVSTSGSRVLNADEISTGFATDSRFEELHERGLQNAAMVYGRIRRHVQLQLQASDFESQTGWAISTQCR